MHPVEAWLNSGKKRAFRGFSGGALRVHFCTPSRINLVLCRRIFFLIICLRSRVGPVSGGDYNVVLLFEIINFFFFTLPAIQGFAKITGNAVKSTMPDQRLPPG